MRAFEIVRIKNFQKNIEKLSKQDQALAERKIDLLSKNPQHPSLRTQKMRGEPGLYESSVNMDIRILWQFEDGRIILLTNIGHHDILKRY